MINFTKRINSVEVLIGLLKHFNIPVDAEIITNELNTHPDYPSLLAINDVAVNFGLDCDAYKISQENLHKIPCPFIANTMKNSNEFMLVTDVTPKTITIDTNSRRKKISLKEFTNSFTGIVLAVDEVKPVAKLGLVNSLFEKISSAKYLLVPVLLLFASISGLVLHFSSLNILTLPYIFLLLFKSAGVVISILLLVQSIDQNNPIIQKLCGGSSGKTDCNAILTSKAANVFEGLSWSEVGFFYFTSTWLTLLFNDGSKPLLQVLTLLNLVSLPYTFYSVYYQAKVAKQWCLLCCTVQALLWLEFLAFVSFSPNLFRGISISHFPYKDLLSLFICLSLPISLWSLLKPLFLKAQQSKSLKSQLRKIKYNKEFFDNVLRSQPKYAMPDKDWSIVLGNSEASQIVTIASNLFCRPCAKMHSKIDEWLESNPNIQTRIVFTLKNEERNIQLPVVRHLISLKELPDKSIIKGALRDWYLYEPSNYKVWAEKYPVELTDHDKALNAHETWCEMAEIKFTPTVLINGYQLPNFYNLNDLKYMLL